MIENNIYELKLILRQLGTSLVPRPFSFPSVLEAKINNVNILRRGNGEVDSELYVSSIEVVSLILAGFRLT